MSHINNLLDWIRSHDTVKNSELDERTKPVLVDLVAKGRITQHEADGAFVEAQGAWEFDQIHICLGGKDPLDEEPNWMVLAREN